MPFRLPRILVAVALAATTAACGQPAAVRATTGAGATLPFAEATLDRLVKEHGALDKRQLPLPQAVFRTLDADGNGTLTRAELLRPMPTGTQGLKASALSARSEMDRLADQLQPKAQGGLAAAAADEPATAEPVAEAREGRTIGGWLLGRYLRLVGHYGSEFMLHPKRHEDRRTPADLGLTYTARTLTAEDGIRVAAWHIPAASKTGKAVILVHGHGASKAIWLQSVVLPALHEAGFDIIAIDLRRHGASTGDHVTFGLHEPRDIAAAKGWARELGLDSLGLLGLSLGGASSIRAAAADPDFKAVWDDCAFASFRMAVLSAASRFQAPFVRLVVAAVLESANRKVGADMTEADPDRWVGRIAPRPLQIVHGEEDPFILAENSRVNYAAAQEPKSLWVVPGAGHANSDGTAPEAYRTRVVAFFSKAL